MTVYLFVSVIVMGAITFCLRALPFLVPGRWLDHRVMARIRGHLPAAIMLILVVYSLSGTDWQAPPHGLPEVLATACVAGLHLAFRSMIASVAIGTAAYIGLQQLF